MPIDPRLHEEMSMAATAARLAGEQALPEGAAIFVIVWQKGQPGMGAYSHSTVPEEAMRALRYLTEPGTREIRRGKDSIGHA
jgi:hypothetical protein